jgi:hypothetical protein
LHSNRTTIRSRQALVGVDARTTSGTAGDAPVLTVEGMALLGGIAVVPKASPQPPRVD